MTIVKFLSLVAFLVVLYILIGRYVPGRRIKLLAFLVLTLLVVSAVSSVYVYATNTAFRWSIDSRWNPTASHQSLSSSNALPLPPNTAFIARYSETGVSYFTPASEPELLSYFTSLADNHQTTKTHDTETWTILYQSHKYTIQIESYANPEGSVLRVDSNSY
ncbi:hypothetical protein [Tumebacillus permanentifrigoris]|uniref:Uncharacterized protein n=1 Tax=Tumebacillus permanentifrigoris TaxID=378543 RepID=A0A316DGS3_9BACL|nr:hypothetical protein [Tumebacillus permanentifrigoris]PWK15773.1 hypothetical protein C7459_10213 [Tumebacillus permanentifrigoris]